MAIFKIKDINLTVFYIKPFIFKGLLLFAYKPPNQKVKIPGKSIAKEKFADSFLLKMKVLYGVPESSLDISIFQRTESSAQTGN